MKMSARLGVMLVVLVCWPGLISAAPSGLDVETVTKHQDQAARGLYRVLSQQDQKSMVFSPFSIATILSAVHAGAAGDTADQMKQALGLPDDVGAFHRGYSQTLKALESPKDVTFKTANVVYIQSSFQVLQDYTALLKSAFMCQLKRVNFADAAVTSNLINSDVSALTNGKIENLVEEGSIDADTRLFLANAVYFKGKWAVPFNSNDTEQSDFFVSPSQKVKTDMMFLASDFKVAYLSNVNSDLLELPYVGDRFKMLVLLPTEKYGLAALENQLKSVSLMELRQAVYFQNSRVKLPKFKLNADFNLVDPLKDLGMFDMFNSEVADLSGITGSRDLFVASAVHKAVIEVNEEGSEAAGTTGIGITFRTGPFTFFADHPFLFFIVDDQTGITMFSGRYTGPSQ